MEPEGESESQSYTALFLLMQVVLPESFTWEILGILGLLLMSAMVSGAEVAFFSLKGEELNGLRNSDNKADAAIYKLLQKPKTLLANILIANNLINIAIVVLSTSISQSILHIDNPLLEFVVQVVAVTFLLVLLGEVTPKIYGQYRNIQLAILGKMLYPFSKILVQSSSFFEKRISKYQSELSKEELNEAIELTSDAETSQEEKDILKGIVNFGDITVKEVMCPRRDIVAYPSHLSFVELKAQINEHKFSRLPIYEGDLDNIIGILHVKDLLPHLEEGGSFAWTALVRKPYFVPEMKEIDNLLREFQLKKMHMAIVVDEYGGTEGLVTLEDILEEIVGEIHDEFDEHEVSYSRLDDHVVVFDGKTSLGDVQKVMKLEPETFEGYKSMVESIGGLVTELSGKIPKAGDTHTYNNLEMKVESADRKKIRRLKITRLSENGNHGPA
jgi:gliding motility-associated protein GldE